MPSGGSRQKRSFQRRGVPVGVRVDGDQSQGGSRPRGRFSTGPGPGGRTRGGRRRGVPAGRGRGDGRRSGQFVGRDGVDLGLVQRSQVVGGAVARQRSPSVGHQHEGIVIAYHSSLIRDLRWTIFKNIVKNMLKICIIEFQFRFQAV